MGINKFRNTVGLAFAMALLAGCASNDTTDNSAAGAGSSSGTAAPVQSGYDQSAADAAALAGLQRVFYFDLDKDNLRPEVTSALDKYIAILRNNSRTVRLEGHADERGTREYNLALGERRANAVANYLSVNGISRDRVETVSYGEERPVATGHDEESWSQNRRVELSLN